MYYFRVMLKNHLYAIEVVHSNVVYVNVTLHILVACVNVMQTVIAIVMIHLSLLGVV